MRIAFFVDSRPQNAPQKLVFDPKMSDHSDFSESKLELRKF